MQSLDQLLNKLDHYQQRAEEAEEFGVDTTPYRYMIEGTLGKIALHQMGDVTGPGSINPEHGAYPGCDRPGERYPTNAKSIP